MRRCRGWGRCRPLTIKPPRASSCGCQARWLTWSRSPGSAASFSSGQRRWPALLRASRNGELTSPAQRHESHCRWSPRHPVSPPSRLDLLRLPLLGRFLRWRHTRLALQLPLFLLALAIILDGLVGPAVAPLNLAGVLPWIHWRGLVVLG